MFTQPAIPANVAASRRAGLLAVVCLAASVLLAGCQTTGRATNQPTVPADGTAELMLYIADQPLLTAEPAYRATYTLATGEVFDGGFVELAASLHERKIVAASWDHAPEQYLNRGTVGYMVCRACGIRGGLNWSLTGLGRYAWRELQYRRIAGPGGECGLLSGGEFVGLLSRAEQHMRHTGKGDLQAVELDPPGG